MALADRYEIEYEGVSFEGQTIYFKRVFISFPFQNGGLTHLNMEVTVVYGFEL